MNKPSVIEFNQALFMDFLSRFNFRNILDHPGILQVYISEATKAKLVLYRGKIIGAFGVSTVWAGVGEVWLLTTETLTQFPLWLIKTIRPLLDPHELGYHRLQAFTELEKRFTRFAELFGFTYEGTLRKHSSNGDDHNLYAITV